MVDSCATCKWGIVAPATFDDGEVVDVAGKLCCNLRAPKTVDNDEGPSRRWPWRPVNAAAVCAEGVDENTMTSFSAGTTELPQGLKGDTGDDGPPGVAGADAPAWYFITDGSSPSGGSDGDFTFKCASPTSAPAGDAWQFYKKIAGVWTQIFSYGP